VTHETDAMERTTSGQPTGVAESEGHGPAHPGRAVPWPPAAGQRGLAAPYPPGGTDPAPEAGRREERFYLRLLVGMVLLIVLGGFGISIIGFVLGFSPGAP
jgi:hypothetical protein